MYCITKSNRPTITLMLFRPINCHLSIVLCMALIGCVTPVQREVADASAQDQKLASTTVAAPGKAALFVFRMPKSFGTVAITQPAKVRLDNQPVGVLSSETFLRVDVEPGNHGISAETEGYMKLHEIGRFDAVAGGEVFLLLDIGGWTKDKCVPVSKEEGQRLLKIYRLTGE